MVVTGKSENKHTGVDGGLIFLLGSNPDER